MKYRFAIEHQGVDDIEGSLYTAQVWAKGPGGKLVWESEWAYSRRDALQIAEDAADELRDGGDPANAEADFREGEAEGFSDNPRGGEEECAYAQGHDEDPETLLDHGMPVCEACLSYGGSTHE